MKRHRIVITMGVLLAAASPAYAVLPVTDAASIAARAIEAGKELLQIKAQVQQTANVFQSVAHLTSVGGIASVLQTPLLRNALPEAGQVGNLMSGGASASSLFGTAQGFLQRNQVYRPDGTDYSAQAINSNAVSLANIQAMATQSLQSLQERMGGLDELQASIDSQPDVQGMTAIEARISSENGFVQTQTAQAMQLQTLAMLQVQVQQQASQQRARAAADSLFNATAALP